MKARKSRSIPAILIGICCLFASSLPLTQPAQGAQEKPLILKVSIFTPAGITYTKANCWILEEIEKRSKGRIKFEYYFSASLLPAKETVNGLKTGVPDIAIASAGGYPKDINLYQVTKTMDNAVQAVRPGGVCIVAAACRDMREPWEFFGWFERPTVEEMDFGLRSNYTIAGWVAMTVREFCRTGPIILLTDPRTPSSPGRRG